LRILALALTDIENMSVFHLFFVALGYTPTVLIGREGASIRSRPVVAGLFDGVKDAFGRLA
jgi:hypothetical protein